MTTFKSTVKLGAWGLVFLLVNFSPAAQAAAGPTIAFSGYFGGSSQDAITAVTVDNQNNIIVAGWTNSANLPVSSGARPRSGGVDAFVAGFRPDGGGLIFCTYLGGSADDRAFAVITDASRNIYVTGWTSSTNFPVVNALQPHLSGPRDAFVTKLTAAGGFVYSTYLGGGGVDVGYGIGVDSTNAVTVVGDTTSTNLKVTANAFQPTSGGVQDAFVAKISAAGTSLAYLSYLGGSGVEHASTVNVFPSGGITIGGSTFSTDFPTIIPSQPSSGGGQDGFVVRINPSLQVYFSSYLGGSGNDQVNSLSKDAVSNNVIAAGTTSSPDFPVTPGALQTTFGGQTDGFVARISSTGVLLQATYLGGSLSDGITAIGLDFSGQAILSGYTVSQDFPVQRPIQNANAGAMDAFVIKLNKTLSSVVFGTYVGGSGNDQGNAIAVDSQTSIIIAGQTGSPNLPVTGSLAKRPPSSLTSFITKITPSFTLGVAYANQAQKAFTADPWHVASYTASTLYGNATDTAVVGDWTGSGVKRIGLFRNGTWILDTNGNGVIDAADKTVVFGQAGDVPVVGDWRGIGQIALGLFRNGTFILDLSGHLAGTPTGLQDATFVFGQGGDVPVAGDWNNSGTTKVGIFRNGLWLLDSNGDRAYTSADRSYTYGKAGDVPVVGDWDSSGTPNKIGVYRAGIWLLDYDGDGVLGTAGLTEMSIGFGFSGYSPLVF